MSMAMLTRNITTPMRVMSRSGDTVSDDTPSHANESILRSGYLLSPAKRLPRS